MALSFTVTREDMLRSKVLDPGWYKIKVKKVSQEPSNAGDSTNTWIDFTVLAGPQQRDGSDPKDTPIRRCFSEKAPGFVVPYLIACGVKIGQAGGTFDIEKSMGKEMLGYVQNRMWEGKPQNDLADFKALDATEAAHS